MLAVIISIPSLYGLVSAIIFLINKFKDRQYVLANPTDSTHASSYAQQAASGKTGVQLFNFTCNSLLLLITIGVTLFTHFYTGEYDSGVSNNLLLLLGFTIILSGVLLILTPLTFVANGLMIYSRKIRLAEAYAIQNRTNTMLIKVEQVVAWIVYAMYIIYGINVIVSLASGQLSQLISGL
jgi:hypothetical protein